MSAAEVAGLCAAVLWAALVVVGVVVLGRLAKAVKETRAMVAAVTDRTVPLLSDVADQLADARTQLDRVDRITAEVQHIAGNVQEITTNASALSATVNATVAGPLVRAAALGHGVRRALGSSSKPPKQKSRQKQQQRQQKPKPNRTRG